MSLSAEGLGCVRGERVVFAELEFRLEAGGALLLRGPNGSGKTSLLRLLAGLQRPAAGEIAWAGAEVWADIDAHRARLAYLGHLDAVKPLLTVAENVGFWARLVGRPDHVDAALRGFGLSHLAEIPARLLSAGQRKRTALARLAAGRATLWLLDEPDASLDDDGQALLAAAIRRHREAGGCVVAATHHDMDVAQAETLRLGAGG